MTDRPEVCPTCRGAHNRAHDEGDWRIPYCTDPFHDDLMAEGYREAKRTGGFQHDPLPPEVEEALARVKCSATEDAYDEPACDTCPTLARCEGDEREGLDTNEWAHATLRAHITSQAEEIERLRKEQRIRLGYEETIEYLRAEVARLEAVKEETP